MAPSRRRSTTAQKKTTTMPSKRGEQAEKGQQREENSTEQEFESELSGAFSLLSVEGSPSKVRTSDLGKLLLAIGAGEIAEMKPLESIVDINHSGFFTREKVTAALQKLREQGRFPSLDELSGRSASGKRASTVAKNKQQQKRLNDEEQMNQNQMNNASKKILVVDDIGLCRRITTNQLEQLGFKDSPVATSGKEAIQYIDEKQGEVQCILLDIMMPQENGVETLAEIRKHEKFRREHLEPGHEEEEPIKVIAVTALKHGELLSLCESTGEAGHSVMFDGYIEKPATLTKIRDAMETAAIMFASSLPSGLDQKTRKINNNNNNNNNNNSNNSEKKQTFNLKRVGLNEVESKELIASVGKLAREREAGANFDDFCNWLEAREAKVQCIVDGANVGMANQNFAGSRFHFGQLDNVVEECRRRYCVCSTSDASEASKQRPVVFLHQRRTKDHAAKHQFGEKILNKLRQNKEIFVTPHGSNDDWYWLYAALVAGEDAVLISNDEMRDHVFQMLPDPNLLRRWKERHQVRFSVTKGEVELYEPAVFTTCIQENEEEEYWMIPFVEDDDEEKENDDDDDDDDEKWLFCCKKQ